MQYPKITIIQSYICFRRDKAIELEAYTLKRDSTETSNLLKLTYPNWKNTFFPQWPSNYFNNINDSIHF